MRALVQDVRFALRGFRRNPGFTATTVLVLALGIGATTAVFSVVDAVVLRPLPFGAPGELVVVGEGTPGRPGRGTASWPGFRDWSGARSFRGLAAYHSDSYVLTAEGEPELVQSTTATANLFDVLGASPALGRFFAAGEDQPGRNHVAVLSDRLWRRRFASDPRVVGRTLLLGGESYLVIGVAPAALRFPPGQFDAELWAPAPHGVLDANQHDRTMRALQVVGRLAPGVTEAGAQAELDALKARLDRDHPEQRGARALTLTPLQSELVRDLRLALLTLLAAVGFVLLIACANVASLLLARGTARSREIAVRTALGAGRGRLVRQLLTESVLLALFGGALGVALAAAGLEALIPLLRPRLPQAQAIGLDARVLVFAAVVAGGTGIAFGLLPALSASRASVQQSLRQSSPTAAGGRGRARGALLVAEIALAFVLCTAAGLMLRSFARVVAVHPGFEARGLLTAAIVLPPRRYPDEGARRQFYQQLLAKARALPGAQGAAVVLPAPYSASSINLDFTIADRPPPLPGTRYSSGTKIVSPDFFTVMGVPVLRGRAFAEADDRQGAPAVAIISESLAREHWPGQEPLGKRIQLGTFNRAWREIVGIVADVKPRLDAAGRPELYLPYGQTPMPLLVALVRAPQAAALSRPLGAEVRSLDPDLPLGEVATMEQRLADSVAQRRLGVILIGLFAALALGLALVGVHGVVSYTVIQRTRELGIRVALGARRGQVLGLVLGQGLRLAALGLAVGVVVALALTRVLRAQLYGVSPTDPATFLGFAALLLAVSALASLLPARRATRVDPMLTMRSE
jgi:predicted permease